jgi:hypothetical protein
LQELKDYINQYRNMDQYDEMLFIETCSANRVARLMRSTGIKARHKRRRLPDQPLSAILAKHSIQRGASARRRKSAVCKSRLEGGRETGRSDVLMRPVLLLITFYQ